jgi:uncharacterized membrane protein
LRAMAAADAPYRTALRLLGLALAISVIVAFPIERLAHDFSWLGSYGLFHSCEDVTNDLNLGSILQAILTPIFVFLLPGPGSIFHKKVASSSRGSSLTGAPGARVPASFRNAIGEPRPSAAVAVVLFVLGLGMSLGSGLFLKSWIVDHSSAYSPLGFPLASATIIAFFVARLALGLVGIGAAIYLLRRHVSWEPASFFIGAGWLCAVVVAVAWWYGLREYAGVRGVCPDLFDLSRSVPFQVDYLSDQAHYFIYVSVFSAFWVGITAGGLRLQSARAAEGRSGSSELLQFQAFYWACFLGWAVQYRLSQWFGLSNPHGQEWPLFALLNFLVVTASSFWVLAFIESLWKNKPRTWLRAVFQAFWKSFVILLLSLVTFFWLITYVIVVLAPALVTWNVFGLAWALTIGTWHWRARQKEQLVAPGREANVR